MPVSLKFEYTDPFSGAKNSPPTFLRSRGVNGGLSLAYEDGEVDGVKIVLKGTLTNTLRHQDGCSYNFSPYRLVTKAPIIELHESYNINGSLDASNTENLFGFNFPLHRVGNLIEPDSGNMKSAGVIPSSLYVMGYWCSQSPSRYSCSASTHVKYELQAFAYKDDEKVAYLSSEIRIYDSPNPIPPPIHTQHFPGEYVLSQEKRFKNRLGFKGAKLGISVSEPSPLQVSAKDGIAQTRLPMRLILRDLDRMSMHKGYPMEIRIMSRLKIHSFFSAGRMNAHPTDAQSKGSPVLGALTKYGKKFVRKLKIDSWKAAKGGLPGAVSKEMNILLPVLENEKPAPTFFTPFLARRYTIAVIIDVICGWQTATIRLNLPLQIVYPEDPIGYYDNMDSYFLDNEESLPPIYIR